MPNENLEIVFYVSSYVLKKQLEVAKGEIERFRKFPDSQVNKKSTA